MMTPPKIPDRPFTLAQAQELGITRRHLRNLVDARRVRRPLRGVYQRADLPDTLLNRACAAALVVSPFGVLCDRTAAWMHGVDTFEYHELEIMPPLETFVLRGHARIERRGCVGGERDLSARDVWEIAGIRATSPLRTALDLGCALSRRDALAVLDGFMRVCGITSDQMLAELHRYRGRRGVVQLRELVLLADPRSESPGESWTRMDIIDAGLPVPELQWWVLVGGEPTYRLDLAYPKSRLAIEYDGQEFHTSALQRNADRVRRGWLRDHGWTVIVVDKESFGNATRDLWTGEARAALRLAA